MIQEFKFKVQELIIKEISFYKKKNYSGQEHFSYDM